MIQSCRTRKKGFTLVELVVAVVIVAILAAVSIPLVGMYIRDSNANADMAAARSIENAVKVAASEINTDRADAGLTASKTVGRALSNYGLDNSVLTSKRDNDNYHFYFSKTEQTVAAFKSPPSSDYVLLNSATALASLGLVT